MEHARWRFKNGVKIRGVRVEMASVWPLIASVYMDFGYECVITSVCDSKHGAIVHILGFATDFRTRHVEKKKLKYLVEALKRALSDEFDVVLEEDHIHIEFDPR